MANPQHTRSAPFVKWEPCAIGKPPLAGDTGIPLAQAIKHLRHWRQDSLVFDYSWAPPPYGRTNNPLSGDLHVLINSTPRDDGGDRRLCGAAAIWQGDAFDDPMGTWVARTFTWHAPTGSAGVTLVSEDGSGNVDQQYGLPVQVQQLYESEDGTADLSYTPAVGGGLVHCRLAYTGAAIAALSLWHAPEAPDSDFMTVDQAHVSAGRPITCYDSTIPGLGKAVHYLGNGAIGADRVERMTRRNLICTGHQVGRWTDEASPGAQYGGTKWTFPVYARDLRALGAGNDLTCTAAAVVSGSAGAWIKFAAGTSGDSLTLTAGVGGWTTAPVSGDLDIDLGGDSVTITYGTANKGDDCTVHSVFLFEGAAW